MSKLLLVLQRNQPRIHFEFQIVSVSKYLTKLCLIAIDFKPSINLLHTACFISLYKTSQKKQTKLKELQFLVLRIKILSGISFILFRWHLEAAKSCCGVLSRQCYTFYSTFLSSPWYSSVVALQCSYRQADACCLELKEE